jgi:B9 domain-containing protein 2
MPDVTCDCNIPVLELQGSVSERISSFFLGGQPRLKLEEVVHSGGDRFRLQTTTAGLVHLQLSVVMKDFAAHHVKC